MTDQTVSANATVEGGIPVQAALGLSQSVTVTGVTVQDALNNLVKEVDSDLLVVRHDPETGDYVAVNGDLILLREGEAPRPITNPPAENLQAGDSLYAAPRRSNG